MRRAPLGLLLAFAVARSVAAAGPAARRESAAEVARAIAGLRRPRARAEAVASGPARVYVVVRALTAEARAALEAAGLAIELPPRGTPAPRWRDGDVVQGLATPDAEARIRALPFVVRVEPPGEAWTNVGAVTSAGDAIVFGPQARATLGTSGAGVTVGVLSDGVDHAAASVASGDLPADVGVPAIPGVSAPRGDEGTAILEIVHDLAPDAHLLFAGPTTSVEMVVAIAGLAAAGAQVIVDDLVFTDEPKFEDGPIALAARRFVAAGGVYVTAAGNFGASHYFGTYHPGGGATFAGATYKALHRFKTGDFGDSLTIPPGAQVIAVLQWNDAFGHSANDFDLVLATQPGGGVLASGANQQNGTGNPIEGLRYVNNTGAAIAAYLAIAEFARVSPAAGIRLNLVVFTRTSLGQQYVVARESIFGHAAVEDVVSVAAADAARPDTLESFSSQGPATIFFPAQVQRQVPRLTGIDDVETAVGRRGQFPDPFRGTSAAAPHAAACAALLRAAGASPATAVSAMTATALDLGASGFDAAWGAGRLDCGAAARLVSGKDTAPVVEGVSAGFDGSGAVTVTFRGEDAEGDPRSATVRFLDRGGGELARQAVTVEASGTGFATTVTKRAAALARARGVAVRVTDAIGLASGDLATAFGCPGDASVGDALCSLGDFLDRVAAVPGPAGRRLAHIGRGSAGALVRAGTAYAAGRRHAARNAVGVARALLGNVKRLVRARALTSDVRGALVDEAAALRIRLQALRATL